MTLTVNEWRDLENPELKELFKKHLIRGVIFLSTLILIIFVAALSFENEINEFAQWLTDNFGVFGLMIAVFIADTMVSPIPPDVALFFIGRGPLHESWYYLVPLLGAVSSFAGVCGWLIGLKLKNLKYFQSLVDYMGKEHKGVAKRFGFWVVVIGALTPLPFSLTCWLAGIFKMPLRTFLIAASFRIPRFVVYYWAIFYSGFIGSLLRGLIQ